MNIYRIKYATEETLKNALQVRGILDENNEPTDRTIAIVYVGKLIDTPATLDEEGNILTEATYVEGYHCDLLLKDEEDFGDKLITPNTPHHTFYGIG